MRVKPTPRLSRIRLLMLLCIAVLAGFLGYWLHSEYVDERESLRQDMSRTLHSVQSQLADSVIMQDVIRPIMKTVELLTKDGIVLSDVTPDSISGLINYPPDSDSMLRGKIPDAARWRKASGRSENPRMQKPEKPPRKILKGVQAKDAQLIRFGTQKSQFIFKRDTISQDSYFPYSQKVMMQHSDSMHISLFGQDSVQELDGRFTVGDSMDAALVRGVELMIQTMSDIRGKPKGKNWALDTTNIQKEFHNSLSKAGLSGSLHWANDSLINHINGLVLDEPTSAGHIAYVTSYEPALMRRTSPQLLFSLFLLCLTGLAFRMTFRALRSQMQLATIRNDFISNMSHELKTPVSTVKVALEAISEPAVLNDPALAGEYLEMAGLELGRLELLINQALQTALLEEGQLAVEHRPVDLSQVCAQMLRIMQTRFSQQGGQIALFREGEAFQVIGDALHLQGVIINILDNALKYAGPEPKVKMELQDLGHSVRVRISDNGPGIAVHYREKIFDKFFRVPKGNEHSVKGYGLGLAYASQVIRLHDGTISVSGTAGGGCSFEIILPKTQA